MLLLAVCVGTWAADKWIKTAITDLQTNDIVVIVDETSAKALPNNGGTSSAPTATAVTLNSDKSEITSTVGTTLRWEVEVLTSTFRFGVPSTTTQFYNCLYCTNNNNGVRVGTNSNNQFSWDSSTNKLKNEATKRWVGVYNEQDWRCYTTSDGNVATTTTVFYKLVEVETSPLSSITLSGTYPTTFRVGDTFSHEGMTITATYEDATTKDVTANSTFSGYDMSTIGSQTVTVSYTEGEVTKTATYAITVEAIPTHTATFSINGQTTSQDFEEGATIEFPSVIAPDGYTFMGWVTSEIATPQTIAPTFVAGPTMGDANVTFFAVFAKGTEGISDITKTYGFETESDSDWTIDGPVRTEGQGNTGSYAGKINSNNSYVTFNNKVKVKEFSFAFKRTSNNTNYNVSIETSTDNSEWTAAETYAMSDFSNGSYTTKTKSFDGNTELYVRFYCNNTTAIRYVDDVTITYSAATTTYSDYCTTIPVPSIIVTPTAISADAAGETANVTVTYEYVDQNVADVEFYTSSEATATTTCNWVHATFDANKNVELVIDANSGAARNAYMKVYSMDNETNLVYSEVITVTQAAGPSATATIAAACTDGKGKYYGTDSNTNAFILPEGVTASEISVINGELLVLDYAAGAIVPANTGVMISSETAGEKTFYLTTGGTSVLGSRNMLHATGNGITAAEMAPSEASDCLYYRLTMHNGTQIGFWWGAENGGAFAVGANKAYLAVPANQVKAGFAFGNDGDATSISTIDNGQLTMENAYNLQGQKVGSEYKGIVIVNGKKFINK